jgi:hypothetical protein
MKKAVVLSSIILALGFAMCTNKKGQVAPTTAAPIGACDTVTYTKHIAPIISQACGCHGPGFFKGDLTNYTGVKAKVDNGTFKKEVITNKTMPQGSSLSSKQLELITCWLDKGAPNS